MRQRRSRGASAVHTDPWALRAEDWNSATASGSTSTDAAQSGPMSPEFGAKRFQASAPRTMTSPVTSAASSVRLDPARTEARAASGSPAAMRAG